MPTQQGQHHQALAHAQPMLASDAEFRAISDLSPVGMAQVSVYAGKFVRVNAKFCAPQAQNSTPATNKRTDNTTSTTSTTCYRKPATLPLPLKILVADDNRDGADSFSEMLQLMGNDTCTGYDGSQATALARQYQPDVILIDIGLPKLNGCEACRLIREQVRGKDVVLIAVTGWGREKDRHCKTGTVPVRPVLIATWSNPWTHRILWQCCAS